MTLENGRRILLAQMLPHTCIGHPVAQLLTMLGCHGLANVVHYRTLPARARRRMTSTAFNPDKRLRSMDLIFTPICSIARAFGWYRLANNLFRLGPHEIATKLGACGYYYEPTPSVAKARADKEAKEKRAAQGLKQAGYVIQRVRVRGTSIRYPWVWCAPVRHTPTQAELGWIEETGHALKERTNPDFEYEESAP